MYIFPRKVTNFLLFVYHRYKSLASKQPTVAMTQCTGTSKNLWPLPFLPHTKSDPCSCSSTSRQRPRPSTTWLNIYIQVQWIDSNILPPNDWSVFKQPIWTNNDIEGWHNALNCRASCKCRLAFYLLIELLHCEARTDESRANSFLGYVSSHLNEH